MFRIACWSVALGTLLAPGAPAGGAAAAERTSLSSFESARLKRILAPIEQIETKKTRFIKERSAQYVAQLRAVEVQVARTARPESVLKLRAEREAWERGEPTENFAAGDDAALAPAETLRAALDAWMHTLQMQATQASDMAKLKAVEELERLKSDLTRARRTDAAAEIEKLAANLAASMATPPPPKPLVRPPRDRPLTNSLGMRFVPVPNTNVLFSVWETRVRDYTAFTAATGETGGPWKDPMQDGQPVCPTEHCPVVNVSWLDARAFCEWLTKKEGMEYRLPTDAEWSAAVGLVQEPGDTPRQKDRKTPGYPWGAEYPPPKGAGNYADLAARRAFPKRTIIDGYEDGHAMTAPVGSFPPNVFGLHDMGGNVWEWCADWYDPSEGKYRVMRGAAWISGIVELPLRSSYRNFVAHDARADNYGFRPVLVVDPKP